MSRRLLVLLGTAALLVLSTVSASSLGNLTDVSLTQSILDDIDPCEHGAGEPDPCPEGFTPYLPEDCPAFNADSDVSDGEAWGYRIVIGTDGDDVIGPSSLPALRTTDGRDLVFGLDGDDTISGVNGDDCLVGGSGDDTLHGGNHDDVLLGGPGDDRLFGDNHDDLLDGGEGLDTCSGGNHSNILRSCELTP